GRAEQLSTLSRLAHGITVEDETRRLLEAAEEHLDGEDPDSDDRAIVRLARRGYDQSTKLPSRLVAELSRETALAEPAWAAARAESDWSRFAPHLERILALQRESAEHLGYEEHPYNALTDLYERGATRSGLAAMFESLKAGVVPLLRQIVESSGGEDRKAPVFGEFDEGAQERFGEAVIRRFGYDFSRGRQDRAVHPFCIGMDPGDVRITTRFDPNWLPVALFGTFHEAGHGMYEQGVDPGYARTPLAGGTSMGVHESQSGLWENLVGRSRPFWGHLYPELQKTFPEALGSTDLETFYRAINAVEPSEIRVEADELTYNLHILLRFELEVELLDGKLSVAELPEAWNAKMEEYLGLTPENDARGVLQDVHWAAGLLGYFPTYTIGNVLSVQLFEKAKEERPEIPAGIENGEFEALHGWLRENVHRSGSKYDPQDLVRRVTGSPLDTEPYLRYLRNKFGELYNL
ncbi:MAG: carboxypeptidase M32, partial [Rubrobacter sp.]|nr:carboxypeptidase M32 [Rubrobacter sp.]